MSRDVCLTIDVDWAPDAAGDEMASLLRDYEVPSTWFVTHESPLLEFLRDRPDLFEIGVHPNFLLGSSHGKSAAAVLDRVTDLVPEAVSFRSHALVQSGPLLTQVRRDTDLRIDSNIFAPGVSGLRPFSQTTPFGSIHRVPFMWADDYWLLRTPRESSMNTVLQPPGLKVLLFHPVHYSLNSTSLEEYRAFCEHRRNDAIASASLMPSNSSGRGIRDLFTECVAMLSKTSRATRLRDLVDL